MISGNSVYVPLDAVTIGGAPRAHKKMNRSTNGLASGNDMDEAIFHGLCELIERDATTLWGLRPPSAQASTEFEPHLLHDAVVDDLVQRIEQAGMTVRLFDQTSDLGIPVVMATIFDPQGRQTYLDRDDFSRGEYKEGLPSSLSHYAQAVDCPLRTDPEGWDISIEI